ncbi:hypothetical protein [Planctomycetes bacterium K23_9]|uniref:Uncharacterized protein n=1 Tax=Stieleria marina TaxID=1930275 RepID=A0A517NZM9_9BACT|nr:hypothetical protein K239x_45890 [Planctomycetes bacterium K23_9]
MPIEKRSPESCRHRIDPRQDGDRELADCRLLQEIAGVDSHPALVVERDACLACCDSFSPSAEDLNPIVASLLFELSEQIVDLGGVDGCDLQKASRLNAWAERSLPAVAPDEDDSEDIQQRTYDHLAGVSVDQLLQQLPMPAESSKHKNGKLTWSVGITTAPRRLPTLQKSAESVIQAGWDDPVLFIDGEVDLPASLQHLECCRRSPATGAFPNYILSLGELYMRNPHADAYLMIQDDALLLPSSAMRDYLDRVLWFDEGPSIASLYCSSEYNQSETGWHLFPENWVWGAVAFVFSRDAVLSLLQSPMIWEHRAKPGDEGLSRIDVAIGQFAQAKQIPVYFPSPSLVQHIGIISTIWKVARAVNARRANQFIGDQLDSP